MQTCESEREREREREREGERESEREGERERERERESVMTQFSRAVSKLLENRKTLDDPMTAGLNVYIIHPKP